MHRTRSQMFCDFVSTLDERQLNYWRDQAREGVSYLSRPDVIAAVLDGEVTRRSLAAAGRDDQASRVRRAMEESVEQSDPAPARNLVAPDMEVQA